MVEENGSVRLELHEGEAVLLLLETSLARNRVHLSISGGSVCNHGQE